MLPADKRKQILRAAVEVFAERGFHRTRVSDIAKRARVAYGLIYHYFESKDDVLNQVFRESWAVFVKVLLEIEADESRGTKEKLSSIAALLVDALRIDPALIRVIIQEVSRSDRFVESAKVDAFEEAFSVVERIIAAGRERDEVRQAIDPHVGAYIFFGALETVCTGFMLQAIPCATEEDATKLKRSIDESLLLGMLEPR